MDVIWTTLMWESEWKMVEPILASRRWVVALNSPSLSDMEDLQFFQQTVWYHLYPDHLRLITDVTLILNYKETK